MRARIRHKLTKYAVQQTPAIDATTMKLRGDTSHDVSATMRPKAIMLSIIATNSRPGSPRSRRRVEASARAW